MSNILPSEFARPSVLDNPKYSLEWYYENRGIVGVTTPLFTRSHIDELNGLVEQSQDSKIPANIVLQYIDPMFRGRISNTIGPIDTLGYFLGEIIWNRAKLNLDPATIKELWEEIESKRMGVLGAVGAQHPYLWSSERVITVQPSLSQEGCSSGDDLVTQYIDSVERLFDAVENTYDLNDVLAVLVYRREEILYMIEKNIGRGGEAMTPEFKVYLEKKETELTKGVQRLTKKTREV